MSWLIILAKPLLLLCFDLTPHLLLQVSAFQLWLSKSSRSPAPAAQGFGKKHYAFDKALKESFEQDDSPPIIAPSLCHSHFLSKMMGWKKSPSSHYCLALGNSHSVSFNIFALFQKSYSNV
ncbi:hypothetical protein SDJN03_01979, partial [Cucurbita argyrosperma subsp. sororia]